MNKKEENNVCPQIKQGVPKSRANNGTHIIIFSRGIIAIEACKHASLLSATHTKRERQENVLTISNNCVIVRINAQDSCQGYDK
jgi:alanine dehydrogenase